MLQNKRLCFHPAKNHQSFCYLFSPDTQGDTNLFIFVLGGKTRFQLYKSSGLVGWLSAKGKAKNLGRFDQMTFSLNFGDELSELDQSLIPIQIACHCPSCACVGALRALYNCPAQSLVSQYQNTSCFMCSLSRVLLLKIKMHGLFSDHHLRAFDLDVNLGTRAIFVNW